MLMVRSERPRAGTLHVRRCEAARPAHSHRRLQPVRTQATMFCERLEVVIVSMYCDSSFDLSSSPCLGDSIGMPL